MKCDLAAPLEYDPGKRGYVYSEPNWIMPSVRITEGELFALMVAEKALDAYSGTPWAERLRQVFGRMIASLPDRIEVVPQEMLSRVSFDSSGTAEFNPVVLDALAKAVNQNHTVEIEYRPLGVKEPKNYTIDPYVLRRMRGAWYLAGRKHPDGHVPLFNLSRALKVKDTGRTFDFDQAQFDSEKYFKSTFGAFQSDEVMHVVVEFSGTSADMVRERQWHQSQKLTERPGGRLRFEADISSLYDILPWVLSWGAEARAIAPKELARIVADQADQMARQYKEHGKKDKAGDLGK